jgi:hypothetical protein
MKKKAAGLVGAVSALAPVAAGATPAVKTLSELMAPSSYAELLQPIPNASQLLRDAASTQPAQRPDTQLAQYYGDSYYYPPYNYYYGRRGRYHHHHHHHNNYGWGSGWGPYYHHHHHHHHHDYYWRPY